MSSKFEKKGKLFKLNELRIIVYLKFKNLIIKSLRCKNSKFDDNPEITAYLQVKDITDKKNDEVFYP